MDLFGYRFALTLSRPCEDRYPPERREDGTLSYAEFYLGRLRLSMEYLDVYWWDDVRLPFGYRLGLNRWPTPWQRGFWIDRHDDGRAAIRLGAAILHVERVR